MPCYDVMSCLKEVTGSEHGWGEGNVSAGQRESGEVVHSCFGTLRNNWLGATAPQASVGQLCRLPALLLNSSMSRLYYRTAQSIKGQIPILRHSMTNYSEVTFRMNGFSFGVHFFPDYNISVSRTFIHLLWPSAIRLSPATTFFFSVYGAAPSEHGVFGCVSHPDHFFCV